MNYARLFKAIIEDECKNKEDLIKAGYTLDEINDLLSKGVITLDNGLSLTPIGWVAGTLFAISSLCFGNAFTDKREEKIKKRKSQMYEARPV